MLRQTLAAGRSILPGVSASDPALLASTRAFIADLQAVAPTSVAPAWQVVGNALVTVVSSGGDTARIHGVDAAAVQKAAHEVAQDAADNCHVDLSPKK